MPKTEIAFQYDYFEKKWVRCPDDETAAEIIENLPTVLVAKYPDDENLFIYCRKHRKLEPIADENEEYIDGNIAIDQDSEIKFIRLVPNPEKGEIYSATGCSHRGLFGVGTFKKHRVVKDNKVVFIPFRWRVFQKETGEPINIAADVAKAKILAYDSMSVNWLTAAYSVNFSNQKIVVTQSKIINGWDKTNNEIPSEVVDAAIELLRSDSELESGIKPSVLSKMDGHGKIESFVERPFDLNIVYLKNFFSNFGDGDFESLFPRDQKDNYQKICELLQINPPKSLRKAYTFNPYAVVWYMYLNQIGISDINLIQPLLGIKDNLLGIPLSELSFSLESRKVERIRKKEAPTDNAYIRWLERRERQRERLTWLEFYARWMLEYGKEKRFLRWLKEASTVKPVADWQWDILRSLKDYHDKLSVQIKRRLLRDGLTRYVHDIMSWEVLVATSRWKNVSMEYPQEILNYECRINGYEFHVIRETMHLTHLGHMFKNCVASYRNSVVNRNAIIVSAQKDKQYIACIEIQGTRHIVQALGVCNNRLTGDDLLACRYWARVHSLSDDKHYLDFLKTDDGPRLKDWTNIPLQPCREHLPKLPDGEEFECRIQGYEFHVVKENEQMLAVGPVFAIDSETFKREVFVGDTMIVSVQKDGKYIALIIVKDSEKITRAYGVNNSPLEGDDLLVCRYWAKKHLLKYTNESRLALRKGTDGSVLRDWEDAAMEPCREEAP